mgnify:CR=1 FL=1
MFTGIVEEVGAIKNIKRGQHSAVLTIQAKTVLEGTRIGDSIAVNGICLTVTRLFPDGFSADVMHETLNRSSLAGLAAGSVVNLERAMAANGRFGGHIVAGHVDGVGHISDIRRDDTAVWYTVHAGPEILRYVVEKGSIAIDGISVSEYIHPMLTTLCQPMTAMGEASVEILLDIIEGRGVHRHVTLPTALREGASVRQLKH